MNRAIARRTFFERREDFRYFLSNLARSVRRGEIEVHAFSLMGSHYHMLVRSPLGRMADAMRDIQLAYSRWFNRSRRRDGSLVRGRYRSRPVRSSIYRRMLVRYIDFNPCAARIVDDPRSYPYGSARYYARSSGPPWLDRGWVEVEVKASSGVSVYRPADYLVAFPPRDGRAVAELVEARLKHLGDEDALDDLVSGSSATMRAWMRYKAVLADGTRPGLPVLASSRLESIVERCRSQEWVLRRGAIERDAWDVVRVGLHRDLCGATLAAIAERLAVSITKVERLYRLHRAELTEEGEYAARAGEFARQALREWLGV